MSECSIFASAPGEEVHEGAPAQGKQDKRGHDSAVSVSVPLIRHASTDVVCLQLQPAGGGQRKQEIKKEQGTQVQILIIRFWIACSLRTLRDIRLYLTGLSPAASAFYVKNRYRLVAEIQSREALQS
jgi:hypothetical protein